MEKQKKNWFRRHPVWAGIIVLVIINFIFIGALLPDGTNSSQINKGEISQNIRVKENEIVRQEKISLDELKTKIEYEGIGAEDEVISLTENKGVYEIKYDYKSRSCSESIFHCSNDAEPNKMLLENGVFSIIEVFLEDLNYSDSDNAEDFLTNNPDLKYELILPDLRMIKIEAYTTTPKKSGVVSRATITKEQVEKYGTRQWFTLKAKDVGFAFDESFY